MLCCTCLSVCLRMGATVFVQPLDLVKNRMQLSGQGTKAREYKTSFHALFSILKNEGVGGIYTGYEPLQLPNIWSDTLFTQQFIYLTFNFL